MGKLWIISEYYYPIVTSTGYYVTEIAEFLAKKGCDVNVIATGQRYNETTVYQIPKKEIHNGVLIERVLSREIDKNNFFKRAIRLLFASFQLFLLVLRRVKRNDKILLVTNPAFLILLMPFVGLIKGVKYNLLVHDIFPENLLAIGKIKASSLGYRCLKKAFDIAYRRTEQCISIGRDMTEVLKRKIGKDTIVMIPNWSDNDRVCPQKKEDTDLYRELGIDKFVFMFAGNLGHVQGLDNLLKAIDMIDNEGMAFLFIGGGAKANAVKEYADKHDHVIYKGFQDRSNQNDFLNACDVAIVTLNDGMYGLGVPSKSYNMMAAGKPILYIGAKDSEIALCIQEYQLGWVVEPDNPIELAKTMSLIYEGREKWGYMKQNSRKVAETVFAKDIILEKYYSLLIK